MARLLALALALSFAGCGARTPAQVRRHPVDAATVVDDAFASDAGADAVPWDAWTPDAWALDAGDPCGTDRSPLRGAVCETTIFGRAPTITCPDGVVDIIASGEGILRWECGGTRAEAEFPGGTYHGTRMGHRFALCTFTDLDVGDGCRWQSNQHIDGTLDEGTLTLTYDEVVSLSDGSCIAPCQARASVGHR